MFGQLLIKECRQTAKSLIYWLIVLVLIFDFATQLGDMNIEKEPQRGDNNYGVGISDDKNVIMRETLLRLAGEYLGEGYTTYPVGFYKRVTLNEKESGEIFKILKEATGISKESELEEKEINPAPNLSYERFEELMDQADDILGGGSNYSANYRRQNARVPLTYEEALENYNKLIHKDRMTGGYARLFSDYMVIFLGLLPVFLAVTRGLRDKRAGMNELIYTRKCGSAVIIASRYLSMLVMLVIPVLALSVIPLSKCLEAASEAGVSADLFAFVKYTFGWLVPTIMVVLAVGMMLTELTDTALAVLIQGVWWFLAAFGSIGSLEGGDYGWNLMPRHNTELNWSGYQAGFHQLVLNRMLYVLAAAVFVILTVVIYGQKRKGRYKAAWKGIGRLKK